MPFRACIVTVVLSAVVLASPGAAAQDNPSLPIETSIEALSDPDPEARHAAASALAGIGPGAVPALIEALADPEARQGATQALGWIGPAAAPAVPALIDALADPEARAAAASALGSIGPAAAPAVPVLIEALADPEARAAAASALGSIGLAAEPALPALIEALADPVQAVQQSAGEALRQIAVALHDADAVGALGALRDVQDALEHHTDPKVRRNAASVQRAVNYFELQRWATARKDVVDWMEKHPYAASIIGAVPIWLTICIALFWFSPATILKINDVLRPFEFKLPDKLGGMTVPLRHLLLIGILNHRPRVLDAWVSRHVGKARDNFERKRTVEERSVHVAVPVHLEKVSIPELTGGRLRSVFAAGTGRLLIWGEGGLGKTSIACRIARWAMADAPEERPAPHRMLPVLIERELDFEVAEGRDPFKETVRGDLEKLIEAPIGDDLLAALLEQRRVLVIIDHLSEMTEATRRRVRPDVPGFPASALIVTSRVEERLGDVPKGTLTPLRITGDYLMEFMSAYLRERGVRELFPDREFGQAVTRIAELVGERAVTVLLVKLYLDRLIEIKQRQGDVDKEVPRSIPSLVLQYLNDVNRAVPEGERRDARAVHRDAQAVAVACLEERFVPAPASLDEAVRSALAAIDPEAIPERLDYLERRLRLIETMEPERDRVRFLLDPVAEYLAALHLVERYQGNPDQWREFLAKADAKPGGLEAIRGFLLAVRDCSLTKPGDVPEFVQDELAQRAGLDLQKVQKARLRERVARYTEQLKAPDPVDRAMAAEVLSKIGRSAEAAVPSLIGALQDEQPDIQLQAAKALGQIGPAAESAAPALAEAVVQDEVVREEDGSLQWEAALALGQIGPPAVPALIEVLQDGRARQSELAAMALGQIGPAAAAAVPALIRALGHEDWRVALLATEALGQIGPAAAAAVPALVEALQHGDRAVVPEVARALGRIGPAAPALIEALQDEDPDVRAAATEALMRIGPADQAAAPALVEAPSA